MPENIPLIGRGFSHTYDRIEAVKSDKFTADDCRAAIAHDDETGYLGKTARKAVEVKLRKLEKIEKKSDVWMIHPRDLEKIVEWEEDIKLDPDAELDSLSISIVGPCANATTRGLKGYWQICQVELEDFEFTPAEVLGAVYKISAAMDMFQALEKSLSFVSAVIAYAHASNIKRDSAKELFHQIFNALQKAKGQGQ